MAGHRKAGAPAGAPDDEAVGYGRPPAEFRIREGERRNPWGRKGRPKPKQDFLDGTIRIRIDGKPVRVTRDEAIDHFLFEAASRRNVSAAKLLDRRRQDRLARTAGTSDDDDLSPEEEAALLRAAERRLRRLGRGISNDDPLGGDPRDQELEPEVDA
ncbi:hypothetical protein [Bradyrhizobium sp. P5_C11_2]